MCILAFVKKKGISGFKKLFLSDPVEWKGENQENEKLEVRNKCINLCLHVKFLVYESSLYIRLGFFLKIKK